MTPEDELTSLLPPVTTDRQLPRRELHKARLLAAIAAQPARRRPRLPLPRRSPAASGWLVPVSAAVAVAAVAVAAVVLSGTVFGRTARPQPPTAGRTPPAGPPHGKLTRTRHWQLPSSGLRGVVVHANDGSVTIYGDSGSHSASLTARPYFRGPAPTLNSVVSHGVLTVTARCPDDATPSQPCKVSLSITMPSGLPVRASTDLGAVSVNDMTGSVAVTDDLGPIALSGLTGPVTATADNGSIRGHSLASKTVTLTDQLGLIDVAFSAPPDHVVARDQLGAVTISVPPTASYRVAASAQLGSVSVTVPQSASSAHVISATSQLGSVTVSG